MGKVLVGAVALVAVGAAGAGIAAITAAGTAPSVVVVTRVVDGDTFDALVGGRVHRVRMLNIDTPETVDPQRPVECLGPEASAHLASLIPVGTQVRLEYDVERLDSYGRTLAGVFRGETLVNAEMARAGLAVPILIGANGRFHPPVVAARDEAAAAGRGFFGTSVDCTVPAKVQSLAGAVEGTTPPETTPAEVGVEGARTGLNASLGSMTLARALQSEFDRRVAGPIWAALREADRERLASKVRELKGRAQANVEHFRGAVVRAERTAAQTAARVEEAAEARRVRQAEPPRPSVPPEPRSQPPKAPKPAPPRDPVATNPYPGYTGPRCYAPGGKTWKPC